ncbi:AAA family ATPase [Leuconostoc mesenteroides]|uniref:AAA family ATPase n=1 Tax=Leuconostoc mesenteroides TaxID=1245 RepID=UPI002115BCEC|nr:ATP-binding protein [Leuconostoc mesenteroides]UUE17031.1 AAA family ATPase [Leuconostoc mesenteroides]
MLIDLTISNFRSYKNIATFSMETGSRLSKFKSTNTFENMGNSNILKSAFIFGPNANGKTNIVQAFQLIKYLLKNPTDSNDVLLTTDTFGNSELPTSFNLNFTKNDKNYTYFLEYSHEEVIAEYLKVNNKTVLKRDRQEFEIIPKLLIPVKNTFRKNQLLLFLAQSYNFEPAQNAYSWITQDVLFIRGRNSLNNKLLKKFQNSERLQERLLNFVQAADFSVTSFEIVESSDEGYQIDLDKESQELKFVKSEQKKLKLLLKHTTESGTFMLPLSEESEGTQVFISLALQLLANSGQGKLIIIDEFERSLHHELSIALMDIFNNKSQRNQFIITTHDLDLMDNNLRSDQIWFVEKNEFGESDLYSLFDFKSPDSKRNDFGFKKRYIAGKYGANQIINKNRLLQNIFDNRGL